MSLDYGSSGSPFHAFALLPAALHAPHHTMRGHGPDGCWMDGDEPLLLLLLLHHLAFRAFCMDAKLLCVPPQGPLAASAHGI